MGGRNDFFISTVESVETTEQAEQPLRLTVHLTQNQTNTSSTAHTAVLFLHKVIAGSAYIINNHYLWRRKITISVAMEQRTILNEAQLSVLRLLSTMQSMEEVHELKRIISNYYAEKATREMDSLWDAGKWSEEQNKAILSEHLRTPYRHAK